MDLDKVELIWSTNAVQSQYLYSIPYLVWIVVISSYYTYNILRIYLGIIYSGGKHTGILNGIYVCVCIRTCVSLVTLLRGTLLYIWYGMLFVGRFRFVFVFRVLCVVR